jgi:hypothetical protein
MTIVAPVDGDPIDPQWAQDITDLVNSLDVASQAESAVWSVYVPTWTNGGSIGNGTLTGRYKQVGKTVRLKIYLLAGSTTTFGAGVWSWSLPVTALVTARDCGSVYMLDAGTANRSGSCLLNTTTSVFAVSSADGDVSPTVPQTWAVNDALVIGITYEAA